MPSTLDCSLVVTFVQLTTPVSGQASVVDAVKCSIVRYPATSSPATASASETTGSQAGTTDALLRTDTIELPRVGHDRRTRADTARLAAGDLAEQRRDRVGRPVDRPPDAAGRVLERVGHLLRGQPGERRRAVRRAGLHGLVGEVDERDRAGRVTVHIGRRVVLGHERLLVG